MENNFELLEDKVRKAVELVKRLRKENRELQEEHKHRAASGEDARKAAALAQEVKDLRHEREEIRRRIAKLVEALDALE